MAHRIAYLADGAIIELESPADILDRAKDSGLDVSRHLGLEAGPGKRQEADTCREVRRVWKKIDGPWRLHRDIWNAKGP